MTQCLLTALDLAKWTGHVSGLHELLILSTRGSRISQEVKRGLNKHQTEKGGRREQEPDYKEEEGSVLCTHTLFASFLRRPHPSVGFPRTPAPWLWSQGPRLWSDTD